MKTILALLFFLLISVGKGFTHYSTYASQLRENIGQEISPEFYWLGFSYENEKEIGFNADPSKMVIEVYIEETDSLEMRYLSQISKTPFKRNKYRKDCSNCHLWFTSKHVNKSWTTGRFFKYDWVRYDSLNHMQWYKPHFKAEVILQAKKHEQMSFVAGLFLRSGKVDSVGLSLRIDESPEKATCVFQLLKLLQCQNVLIEIQENVPENGIVRSQIANISFLPTDSLKVFLKNEIEIKQH